MQVNFEFLKRARRVHKDESEKKKGLPTPAVVFYALGLFSIALYIIFLVSPAFSDFFNRYIASILRGALALLTSWIPFSLAEFLLLSLPVIIFIFIRSGLKQNMDTWRDVGIYCASVLSVLSLVFSMFTIGFASGYRGSTLAEKLELESHGATVDELYNTTAYFAELVKSEADSVTFAADGFSVMPYSYEELNDKLMEAYKKAGEKYDFLPTLNSRVKPVMLSEAMSYTHVLGVYTFFTGEANINVAFPDYTIPATAAHELAHQRGIAREDEANFIAFLVCMESDDPYIRYSGYMSVYEYLASALSKADPKKYTEIARSIPSEVTLEMIAYYNFFEKYEDSAAAEISGTINDTYLTLQGTEGTKSYGMVVDLAIAYCNKNASQ